MTSAFLCISRTQDGKNYAFAETIRAGQNIKFIFDRYPDASIFHLCESRHQADEMAKDWNEQYKKNGTSIYL